MILSHGEKSQRMEVTVLSVIIWEHLQRLMMKTEIKSGKENLISMGGQRQAEKTAMEELRKTQGKRALFHSVSRDSMRMKKLDCITIVSAIMTLSRDSIHSRIPQGLRVEILRCMGMCLIRFGSWIRLDQMSETELVVLM